MSWAIEHKGIIHSIAYKVNRRALRAGVTLDMEDLVQDGSETAIKAERKYCASHGVKPSTYLYTALLRRMNSLVDYAIHSEHHELKGIEMEELGTQSGDELMLWGFLRSLSEPARAIVLNWLMPSAQLDREIRDRTVGRRCSLKALFHYLKEQGMDKKKLDALLSEIYTKAGLYEER